MGFILVHEASFDSRFQFLVLVPGSWFPVLVYYTVMVFKRGRQLKDTLPFPLFYPLGRLGRTAYFGGQVG